jgi:hypothetical protein
LACSTAFGRLRWCAAVLTRGAEPPGPPRLVVAVGPDPAIGGGRRPGPRGLWWPSAPTPPFVVTAGPDPAIGAGVGVLGSCPAAACREPRLSGGLAPGPRDWWQPGP